MLMMYLANKAGLIFTTEFNATTLDVGESTKMAKELGFKFVLPDLKKYGGYYQWCERENIIPNRLTRACCQYYKENATRDSHDKDDTLLFLFGMRNDESNSRSEYQDEWVNNKWNAPNWLGILPIRKWTEFDVWLYILRENIQINFKYKMGYARVGCAIACPNYTKSTWLLDKYWYNPMFNRWRKILRKDFISNNKWIIMNCTIEEYVQKAWNGGVYRDIPTLEVIKEFAQYNNLDDEDTSIAEKYFNKYCSNGCKNKRGNSLKIKDKNTLAMNMKFHGRQTEKFLCKKCFMNLYNMNEDTWNNYIAEFKIAGCALF